MCACAACARSQSQERPIHRAIALKTLALHTPVRSIGRPLPCAEAATERLLAKRPARGVAQGANARTARGSAARLLPVTLSAAVEAMAPGY